MSASPKLISLELYKSNKTALKEIERTNLNKIVVVFCRGSDGWCEIAERSALIYYYHVCPENKKPNFEVDADSFHDQYELGRIRFRNFDALLERIKEAGLYKSKTIRTGLTIINLNRSFDILELTELKAREYERRERNKSVIKIKFSNPVLWRELCEASHELRKALNNKIDRLSSQTTGTRIIEKLDKAMFIYQSFSLHGNESYEAWDEMYLNIQSILQYLYILTGANAMSYNSAMHIGKRLLNIQEMIKNSKETCSDNTH